MELEKNAPDPDAGFIFLWIAFNAAYGGERKTESESAPERETFVTYFRKIEQHDSDRRIYNAIWSRFSQPIRLLLENEYVFKPFWDHHIGVPGCENWQERFASDQQRVRSALAKRDACKILEKVFDRLYVLRNQLLHGSATWNGRVNRKQVKDGAVILRFLMPVFLDVMMNVPLEDWGKPPYEALGGAGDVGVKRLTPIRQVVPKYPYR